MHLFGKTIKEINNVAAFLAVDVMDIVRAPKFFVIAAEHDEPKKPNVENKVMTIILFAIDQVAACPNSSSSIVPGTLRNCIPRAISPLSIAAIKIAIVEKE